MTYPVGETELLKYWSTRKELRKSFIEEIAGKPEEIDPESDIYWGDMAFGWAIAKDLPSNDAREFANVITTEIALVYPSLIDLDTVAFQENISRKRHFIKR